MRSTFLRFVVSLSLIAGVLSAQRPVEEALATKTLLRGSFSDPNTLDPQQQRTLYDYNVQTALFEGLLAIDPDTGEAIPATASSWEIREGGRVFVFHLRPEARWSNGAPVTADDFVFAVRRALSPNLGAENVTDLFVIKGAAAQFRNPTQDFSQVGVRALDAHTLEIELEEPTLRLLRLLTNPVFFPVPREVVLAHGAADDPAAVWTRPENLVGNGPFRLKHWVMNSELLVEKNAHYWDHSSVRLNAISFRPLADLSAEEKAYRAGQLHVTFELPPGRIPFWEREAPTELAVVPGYVNHFIRLNMGRPPLDNPGVRRALALSIDRELLTEKILGRSGEAAMRLLPFERMVPASGPMVLYNPEEARRVLAEAGYPGGKGLPTLEILISVGSVHQRVYEVVQQMWRKELGVRTRIQSRDLKVFYPTLNARDYQIGRTALSAPIRDPGWMLSVITFPNVTGWESAEFSEALAAGNRALTLAEADTHYTRAERLLVESGTVIPLYFQNEVFLLHPTVQGWSRSQGNVQLYKRVSLEKR